MKQWYALYVFLYSYAIIFYKVFKCTPPINVIIYNKFQGIISNLQFLQFLTTDYQKAPLIENFFSVIDSPSYYIIATA